MSDKVKYFYILNDQKKSCSSDNYKCEKKPPRETIRKKPAYCSYKYNISIKTLEKNLYTNTVATGWLRQSVCSSAI